MQGWEDSTPKPEKPASFLARALLAQGQGLQHSREEFSHTLHILEGICHN